MFILHSGSDLTVTLLYQACNDQNQILVAIAEEARNASIAIWVGVENSLGRKIGASASFKPTVAAGCPTHAEPRNSNASSMSAGATRTNCSVSGKSEMCNLSWILKAIGLLTVVATLGIAISQFASARPPFTRLDFWSGQGKSWPFPSKFTPGHLTESISTMPTVNTRMTLRQDDSCRADLAASHSGH